MISSDKVLAYSASRRTSAGAVSGSFVGSSLHDDGRAVRQEGLFLLAAVDEVRQQEVVVADLNRVLPALAGVQETAVSAVLPPAITPLTGTQIRSRSLLLIPDSWSDPALPGAVAGLAGGGCLWLPSHLAGPADFQPGVTA